MSSRLLLSLAAAIALGPGCGDKAVVHGRDQKVLERLEIGSTRALIQSYYEGGKSGASQTGKWGLGSSMEGRPFGVHGVELRIERDGSKTRVLKVCDRYWKGGSQPTIEQALQWAREAFRDGVPVIDHCKRDRGNGLTTLVIRCRADASARAGAWHVVDIAVGRPSQTRFLPARDGPIPDPELCDEALAAAVEWPVPPR